MALKEIDEKRRGLLPWLYEDHRAYVIAKYDSIKATHPDDAKAYIMEYVEKEKEDDASYEAQGKFLEKLNESNPLAPPQELPEREKLEWVPDGLGEPKKSVEKKKVLSMEEFDALKASEQKSHLKKLKVEGDMSNEEERKALYEDFLSSQ